VDSLAIGIQERPMDHFRDEQRNPYASPDTDNIAEDDFDGADRPVEYAGFLRRFFAVFIDGIVLRIISIPLGFVYLYIYTQATGLELKQIVNDPLFNLIDIIIGTVVTLLYFTLQESSNNRGTLGKLALGLRVVDEQGDRITFTRALGRWCGKFLSTILLLTGFLMQPFTEKKQALHDMMAGTLVLKV
jgi:uncharacterized RDD family membrane protein YckC